MLILKKKLTPKLPMGKNFQVLDKLTNLVQDFLLALSTAFGAFNLNPKKKKKKNNFNILILSK